MSLIKKKGKKSAPKKEVVEEIVVKEVKEVKEEKEEKKL